MTKWSKCLIIVCCLLSNSVGFTEESLTSIEAYNEKLPVWGVSWKAGSGALNGYYPSFYTGFAPRQQEPNRIHIRLSRGNQTRMTTILDEKTVFDYLYDLKARTDYYTEVLEGEYVDIAPKNSALVPHVNYFQSLLSSGVLDAVEEFDNGEIEKTDLYLRSLKKMKELNPGRVFDLSFDLSFEFLKWRDEQVSGADVDTASSSQEAMVLINHMLWGRVNLTRELTEVELNILGSLLDQASVLSEEGFVLKSYELFSSVTDGKYDFLSLGEEGGGFVNAKSCASLESCFLKYSEMTSIYPTGTLKAKMRDRNGNNISRYATPGLHVFIDSGSRGDVDNIRTQSFYGFAPKMDFEAIGNGFHNPAVRLEPNRATKEAMNIPSSHNAYWPVKRGGVSSGCERLPLGHIWEMRNRLPVQNSGLKNTFYFGNDSRDFDVFDIDGDGNLEVMGVKYYIQFNTKGSSGLAKREGENLNLNSNVMTFFRSTYGKNGIFKENGDGTILMLNPTASIHTTKDIWEGSRSSGRVRGSNIFLGEYPLYEQDYEQDKVQFYTSYKIRGFGSQLTGGGKYSLGKRFVRLFGRVRGCAPFSNKETCGEAAFKEEKNQIFGEIR